MGCGRAGGGGEGKVFWLWERKEVVASFKAAMVSSARKGGWRNERCEVGWMDIRRPLLQVIYE